MDILQDAIAALDLQYKLGMDKETAVNMTATIFDLSEEERAQMVEAVTPIVKEWIPEIQAIMQEADCIDHYYWLTTHTYNRHMSLCIKRLKQIATELNEKLTRG